MLGNEKLSNAIAQVEGGCAQLNGEELAANANATEQGAAIDEKVQAVTQARMPCSASARCSASDGSPLNEERPHLRAFSCAAQFFNR